MIVIGHNNIKCDLIYQINILEDIKNTPSNSVVFFSYDINIMNYCYENSIPFAVEINTITQAIFANNLMAKYIIVEPENSKQIQNIAENYMFDSKVLAEIKNDDEIESLAKDGIDGVVYKYFLRGK